MNKSLIRPAPSREVSAIHDQRNRAGAGVLCICNSTRRILLALRGLEGASPETWAPFGGMVEPGEHPRIAAIRENDEEAGIKINPNDPALTPDPIYVDESDVNNEGFKFYTYAYVTETEFMVTLNDESSGYAWISIDKVEGYPLHPGFRLLIQSEAWTDIHSLSYPPEA